MRKPVILCINDQETLNALELELIQLNCMFDIKYVETATEAHKLTNKLKLEGGELCLVLCDHNLVGENGTDFLIHLAQDDFTSRARKLLISSNTDVQAIIQAVNQSRLDHIITKPWNKGEVLDAVVNHTTTYILAYAQNSLAYANVLDQQRILRAQIDRQIGAYRQNFIDYSQFSEDALAQTVITGLNTIFKEQDEQHACRCYSSNHHLTYEGEPNHYLWLIVKGQVALKKYNSLGVEVEIIRLNEGSLVGGMSFMSGDKAFTSGMTTCNTEVIKLDKALFSQIMSDHSELLPAFTNLLLQHFSRRNQHTVKTEIKLQETLNALEEAHQQLIENEKMAVLGQLVAGVAHELNNPVSAILRGADSLKQHVAEISRCTLSDDLNALGRHVLQQALTLTPLSTQETRERAKKLNGITNNNLLAKKAVAMGLDVDPQALALLSKQKDPSATITQLNSYYQAGSFTRNIDVCAQRIADLVKSLKHYAGQDTGKSVAANILEGIEETLVIFENKLKQYQLIKEYDELPLVECYPIALQQVWTNLISNAIDATKGTGKIKIQAIYLNSSQQIQLIFEDDGPGIPYDIQHKIFELNYTTKREGNFGLGIGLTVCQQIIHQHHGKIKIESSTTENTFTRFIITLPIKRQHKEAIL